MIVKVIEIHHNVVTPEEFTVGDMYSTMEATIVSVTALDSNSISFKIDIGDMSKLEFIKTVSSDFSNAFIVIAPNMDQDIIVDFTLNPDKYFMLLRLQLAH